MTLTAALERGATQLARQRQLRAELRLDEIVKTAGIADDYLEADRKGDLDVETHFGRMWHAAPNEEMRTLISRAFVAWQKDEQAEERAVIESVGAAVHLLKHNNPTFIDGAFVPSGSDGAA